MRIIKPQFLLILVIFLLNGLNLSGYIYGDLEGYVYDHTGIPLTDAFIRVMELNKWTLTDFRGHYQFKDLPIGNYTVVYDHAMLGAAITDSIQVNPLDITFNDNRIHYYDALDFPMDRYEPPKPKKRIKFVSSKREIAKQEEQTKVKIVRPPINLKGGLKGQVKDPNGEPVRYALINIVELGIEMEADYEGYYHLEELEPGIYTVVFSKDGYENRRFIGVLVKKARTVTKNVTLRKQ